MSDLHPDQDKRFGGVSERLRVRLALAKESGGDAVALRLSMWGGDELERSALIARAESAEARVARLEAALAAAEVELQLWSNAEGMTVSCVELASNSRALAKVQSALSDAPPPQGEPRCTQCGMFDAGGVFYRFSGDVGEARERVVRAAKALVHDIRESPPEVLAGMVVYCGVGLAQAYSAVDALAAVEQEHQPKGEKP